MADDDGLDDTSERVWRAPSVDRPVATLMVVAAVVVFGWVSLAQLPVDLMPELSYPTITVRTEYPGAAPEEVEDAITRPIEEYLGTVEGMVGMSSVSRAGWSDVVFRFTWDTELDMAIQKIRERISLIPFPDDARPPLILRYDPSLDPIVEIAVTGEGVSAAALRAFVEEEVERELEELEGVAMVRVTGGETRLVRVALDEGRLQALGVTPELVSQRLRMENVNVAGGRLYEGEMEYLVRTVNEFGGIEDIREVVLSARGGAVIRLGDVATVEEGVREREVETRIDGRPSVELSIYKDADANLVAVADRVRRRIHGTADAPVDPATGEPVSGSGDEAGADAERDAHSGRAVGASARPERRGGLAASAPEGVRFEVLTDQSQYVEAAIDEVTQTALLGGLCAIVVLFVFLRQGFATLVIGLAIPLSVIATFAPLRLLGVSVNIMSLGGIALGIGMLVDNAIVVLESIVRCREEGDAPREAAIRGTGEVAGAVTASTLTTVAVFFPIVFVEGIAGQLFGDLGAAVVLSLMASLAFALFFVPMMTVLPSRVASDPSSAGELVGRLVGWSAWATFRGDLSWARRTVERSAWRLAYVAPLVLYAALRLVVWGAVEFAWRLVAVVVVAAALVVGFVVRQLLRAVGVVVGVPTAAFGRGLELLTTGYRALLRGALRARGVVVVATIAGMWWALAAYPTLGMQLIPELRQGVFTVELAMPVGTRLVETSAVAQRLERALDGAPEVERVAVMVGRDVDDLEASDRGEHTASITIVAHAEGSLEAAEDAAHELVRRALALEPAAQFEIARPTLFSLDAPLVVQVRGEDLEQLRTSAARVQAMLAAVPGVRDVRSSTREGFPEVRVRFDRERLAALGLDVRTVAETVRAKVQGNVPTELREEGRSIDVEVAIDRRAVADLEGLRAMTVAFVGGATAESAALAALQGGGEAEVAARPIRLSAVAEVEVARGPAEIRHVDGQRAAVVSANTSALDLAGAAREVERRLAGVALERDQIALVAGQTEEMEAARRSLGFALALAVFLVYVVMASNFESLLGPLVILVAVPLAMIGVVGVLAWTGTPVSVVVLIGAIVLAGIIVNNAIVLIDYAERLRRRGMAPHDAIVEACALRLRPVLITTTTTVLGLVPMALGLGEGAEIRRPLAWVVIAGLTCGTLLTLVVIPVLFDAVSSVRSALSSRGGARV